MVSRPLSSYSFRARARPTPMWISLTIRCLLCSWLCFGGLELLEQLHVMPEVEDQDEAALIQVASGLKSAVSSHEISDALSHTAVTNEVPQSAVWFSVHTPAQFGRVITHAHDPPSLRLHQQLSVYRI